MHLWSIFSTAVSFRSHSGSLQCVQILYSNPSTWFHFQDVAESLCDDGRIHGDHFMFTVIQFIEIRRLWPLHLDETKCMFSV